MSQHRAPARDPHEPQLTQRARRGTRRRSERTESYRRYHRYLFSKVQPFLKGRVCEVGSGCGAITQFLGGYEYVCALEPQRVAHLQALQRFAYQLNVHCVHAAIEDCASEQVPAGSFDSVFSIHLLEHIEYDITALEIMGELLTDTGHVVAVVPAYHALYGRLDQRRGHLRRFNRRTLETAFVEAGLVVTTSRYFNAPAVPLWWLYSRVLSRERIPRALSALADCCVPLIERIERNARLPFGASLLMVGKKGGRY